MSNENYKLVEKSPLFDKEWFCKTYSLNDDVDPIIYYLENYADLELNPSPYFDTMWYLKEYSDVSKNKVNPLIHYIKHGKSECRLPLPYLFDLKYKRDYAIIFNSEMFDKDWFCKTYSLNDDVDPIIYYLENYADLELNPSPYFDTMWYLEKYGDVAKSNINPFVHYILHGINEDRLPKQDSMLNLVNKIVEIDFDDIYDNFEKITDERFGLIINYNNVKYDFLVHIKSNANNVYVLGSGIIPHNESSKYYKRPVFKRQSWDLKPEMDESTIFFNDPTRYTYPDLLGGWGLGTPDDYYLKNISKILSKLFTIYEIENDNVIFYSSSMGGFMSIQLATMMPNTTAWADIPQTNLEKFYRYLEWKCIFQNTELDKFLDRIQCIELIKRYKYMPKLYLVIDCYEEDLLNHFYPFLDDLEELDDIFIKENIKILINPIDSHQFLSFEQFIYLKNKYFRFDNGIEDIWFLAVLENNFVKELVKEKIENKMSSLIKKIVSIYGFE